MIVCPIKSISTIIFIPPIPPPYLVRLAGVGVPLRRGGEVRRAERAPERRPRRVAHLAHVLYLGPLACFQLCSVASNLVLCQTVPPSEVLLGKNVPSSVSSIRIEDSFYFKAMGHTRRLIDYYI